MLRQLTSESLEQEAILFPVKDGLMYIEKRGKGSMGHSYYHVPNPPFGATITYYLKESLKTLKEKRQEAEKEAKKKGEEIRYPSWDKIRAEDEEEKPYLLFTITDKEGTVIRRLKTPAKKGMHRLTWDFRYPNINPVKKESSKPFDNKDSGFPVMPDSYFVIMGKVVNGVYSELADPQTFKAVVLENTTLPAEDREELTGFHQKIHELNRVVQGAVNTANDLKKRIGLIKQALHQTPGASEDLTGQVKRLEQGTREILTALTGDKTISKRNGNQPPSISGRVRNLVYTQWRSTSAPTQTMRDQYSIAGEEFESVYDKLKNLLEADLKAIEDSMESASAPWTPGRLPEWNK
jgi:hypothetical protein